MKLTKKMLNDTGAKIGASNMGELSKSGAPANVLMFSVLVNGNATKMLRHELFKDGEEEIDVSREEFANAGSAVFDAIGKKNEEANNPDRAIGDVLEQLQTMMFLGKLEDALFGEEDGDADA